VTGSDVVAQDLHDASSVDPVVYANVARVLRDVLGLGAPDLTVPLHRKLFDTVATLGQRIIALRYVFNWELVDAGQRFATARASYELAVAKAKVRLFADDPKLAIGKAEVMVDADDQAHLLKLEYLVAEQRERGMRKFLDTLDAALENHRTDRADQRGRDRAHADGYGGGA
jgi:hypothetical protein